MKDRKPTAIVPPGKRPAVGRARRPSFATRSPLWGTPADPCVPVPPDAPGDWFLLRCQPSTEFVSAALLRARDVPAWIAHGTVWIRANRYHARARLEARRALFPGYVFAKLDHDDALAWARVFTVSTIAGVVSFDGAPARIRPGVVDELVADLPRLQAMAGDARLEPTRILAVGDRVQIRDAAFADRESEVLAILDASALVSLKIFGVKREVRVPLEKLAAIA